MIYLLAAIGFVIDIVFIIHDDMKKDGLSILFKSLASLVFVIIGINLLITRQFDIRAKYILASLACNFLGDVILILRNVDSKHKDLIFVGGTLSFLIGHVFLLLMLINNDANQVVKSLIITLIITVIVIVYIAKRLNAKKAIKCLGVFYTSFAVYLFIYALLSYIELKEPFISSFVFGYFLFMVSDIILTIQKFDDKAKNVHALQPLYRVTYYISQILIAISIFFI